MAMTVFQVVAIRSALFRSAGRMLGIAALTLLAACSRDDAPTATGPGTAVPPVKTAALPAQQGHARAEIADSALIGSAPSRGRARATALLLTKESFMPGSATSSPSTTSLID